MQFKLPPVARRFLDSELFRYLVSGSVAFICDFSTLVFCTEVLGIYYLYSNIAGYAVGFFVSYTINVRWVFRHRRFDDKKGWEFAYFTLIVLSGLAMSEAILWYVTESFDVAYTWSKVVSTFWLFVFNFVIKKWLLFSPTRD